MAVAVDDIQKLAATVRESIDDDSWTQKPEAYAALVARCEELELHALIEERKP